MGRLLVATGLAMLCGVGCGADPQPYVILRIQDPLGWGAEATTIRVTDVSGNTHDLTPVATGFPMTLTLTSRRKGPQRVTVDLVASEVAVVRGIVDIDFATSNTKVVDVDLVLICAPLGSTDCSHGSTACTTPADCDDGVYCNGAETCVDGQCGAGSPPCLGACDNTSGCVIVRCPGGTNAECTDNLVCNGTETCSAGVCMAGTPLALPNGSECAPAICDESLLTGVAIAADETACLGGSSVCYEGQCVARDTVPTPCSDLITFATQDDGTIMGGAYGTVSLNELMFVSVSNPAIITTWRVMGDVTHGNEIQPFSDTSSNTAFAFAVASPQRIGSMQIRSADGSTCRVVSSPTILDTTFVRSMDYATVGFDVASEIPSGDQRVQFVIQCPRSSAGAGNVRLANICLVPR